MGLKPTSASSIAEDETDGHEDWNDYVLEGFKVKTHIYLIIDRVTFSLYCTELVNFGRQK